MRIGIIGPNKFESITEVKKISDKEIKSQLTNIANILAKSNYEILLTPDKNSLLSFLGKKYLEDGGKKILEIVPLEDKYKEYMDISLGEIISCSKWELQPSKFNQQCDILLCLGYGGMTLAEIGFSKYYRPKKIYILKDFISRRLPREIESHLDIEYIKIANLKKKLKLTMDYN